MSNYSKEEIKQFEAKDKRISKIAVVKSLIQSLSVEDIYDTDKVCELADKYVTYIYGDNGVEPPVSSGEAVGGTISWEEIARELSLTIPNQTNIKVLDALWDEYKIEFKVSANPAILLAFIWDSYHKYPTNKNSIKTILKDLRGNKNE